MAEKWITVKIGGYPRRCLESKLKWIYEEAERIKKEYIEKGAPREMVEEAYRIEIMKDDD